MHYLSSIPGHLLKPGDVIIANQTYAEISHIYQGYIYTDAGKRLYSPSHFYPVFTEESKSESEAQSSRVPREGTFL